MIAVRLEGRLGNQLFQYAFIYTASKKLNTSFYLDKSVENFMLPKYFEVKNDFITFLDNNIFSIDGYKNIFRIHAKRAFYSILNGILLRGNKTTISSEAPVNDAFKQLKNNRLYCGFFQSETYFEDYKDKIRSLYKIKKEYTDAFALIQKQFPSSKKQVVIHIRRSDYVGLDISLPLSYYKKAIENIAGSDLQYIFISDDPSFIENEFSHIPDKYISVNSEIIDLQFLINGDVCILSNSSFSWWGAWLNNKKNKKVFAPKYWFGFKEGKEYPSGVFENIDINQIAV